MCLNFKNNRIAHLSGDTFSSKVKFINLKENPLTRLQESAFSSIARKFTVSRPLICDCSLKWLGHVVPFPEKLADLHCIEHETLQWSNMRVKHLFKNKGFKKQCNLADDIKSKEFPSNSRVLLACGDSSFENSYTWWKDDKRIDSSDRYSIFRNGSLIVENTSTRDSGIYSCQAKNKRTNDRKKSFIRIEILPLHIEILNRSSKSLEIKRQKEKARWIEVPLPEITAKLNSKLVLRCISTYGHGRS